jgi:hypothetical protein
MKRLGWVIACALCMPVGLRAQAAPCPAAADTAQQQLLGLWRAQLDGSWSSATVLLEPHPEYTGSVRGEVNRNGERARVSGDVDEGALTLEESADGQRISATWLGDVVEGSCGREIRGTWQAEGDAQARPFVLRKLD